MDILEDNPEITLADLQTGSAPAGITREWMESMVYSSGRKVRKNMPTFITSYIVQ